MGPFLPQNPFLDTLKVIKPASGWPTDARSFSYWQVYFTDVPSVRYKFSGILGRTFFRAVIQLTGFTPRSISEPLNCGFCESLVRWAVHLFATAVIDDSEAVVPSTPGGDPERPDPSLSGNRQSP